jgi:hypothetical protein
MAYLWFSSPVPVWINPTCCQQISHVEEAAEILLYHWPKAAIRDPICVAAQRACYDALRGAGGVENARTVFETAAREVGVLAK